MDRKDGVNHPPYNLRINKSIDRLLLANIIRDLHYDDRDCSYYSFGGPFLEDLRVMDHFFPNMNLTSIESDGETYKRQIFHLFKSNITLVPLNFRDFLNQYNPGITDIFWLDYTNLAYSNFTEFEALLSKVPPTSIVRITLRAEPRYRLDYYGKLIDKSIIEKIKSHLEEEFIAEFGEILPTPPVSAFLNQIDFSNMVQAMVRISASHALDISGSDVDFMPIQSSRYKDSTNMISVTGIVYLREQKKETEELIQKVRKSNTSWDPPVVINIPNLSLKERLSLEKNLPVKEGEDAGKILNDLLDYCIANEIDFAKKQLNNYAEYYKDYPNFFRTIL